jgi:predicted RNA-binding Zn ribbon-like protein
MGQGKRRELLVDLTAWLSWLEQAGVLQPAVTRVLGARWSHAPDAARALEEARAFRADLRRAVERITQGKPVPRSIVETVNRLLRTRVGYAEVAKVRGGFTKRFHLEFHRPSDLLVPVAEAASDLFCHADFSLIKRCENSACILFFYDRTKNHARRWCSMQWCGNRMKAAAFYERRRALVKAQR